jgi:hypothetical protein
MTTIQPRVPAPAESAIASGPRRTVATVPGPRLGWMPQGALWAASPAQLLTLQALAGNAAVGAALAVQRCGGVADCGCVHEPEDPAPTPVQRQNPPDQAQTPPDQLPPDSKYNSLNSALLDVLKRSFRAGSIWFWAGKPTIQDALDGTDSLQLATLVMIHQSLSAHGLWNLVDTITNAWFTTSRGIDFKPVGDVEGTVNGRQDFCKDTAIGQSEHPGFQCWREVKQFEPGLHFCLGSVTSVHIDMHQAVEGTGNPIVYDLYPAGGGPPKIGQSCSYSVLAVIRHWMDLKNIAEGSVFDRIATDHERLKKLRDRSDAELGKKDATKVDTEIDDTTGALGQLEEQMRPYAMEGFDGERKADEVPAFVDRLDEIERQIGHLEDRVDLLSRAGR